MALDQPVGRLDDQPWAKPRPAASRPTCSCWTSARPMTPHPAEVADALWVPLAGCSTRRAPCPTATPACAEPFPGLDARRPGRVGPDPPHPGDLRGRARPRRCRCRADGAGDQSHFFQVPQSSSSRSRRSCASRSNGPSLSRSAWACGGRAVGEAGHGLAVPGVDDLVAHVARVVALRVDLLHLEPGHGASLLRQTCTSVVRAVSSLPGPRRQASVRPDGPRPRRTGGRVAGRCRPPRAGRGGRSRATAGR